MFLITIGVIALNAGLVEIAPIWRQGPSSPGAAGAGSQPDWYTAFLDGALRLVPSGWEVIGFGRTWTLGGDRSAGRGGRLLRRSSRLSASRAVDDRRRRGAPPSRPAARHTRPDGLGVAGLLFYGTLWAAGSADLIATQFQTSFNAVIQLLQVDRSGGSDAGFRDHLHRLWRHPGARAGTSARRGRVGSHRAVTQWWVRRGAPTGDAEGAFRGNESHVDGPSKGTPEPPRQDHAGRAGACSTIAPLPGEHPVPAARHASTRGRAHSPWR